MLNDLMFCLSWSAPIILLLGTTLVIANYSKLTFKNRAIGCFFCVFLLIDLFSRYIQKLTELDSNLHLLSWSAIVEFVLFAWLYSRFFITSRYRFVKWFLNFIGLMLLINLVSISSNIEFSGFQAYDRLLVDGVIMLLGLFYIYAALDNNDHVDKSEQYTNIFILLYVTVDLFMSLTINFMINASIPLVFFFWLFRLAFMLLLYLNLIHGIWQNGKIQRLKHFG